MKDYTAVYSTKAIEGINYSYKAENDQAAINFCKGYFSAEMEKIICDDENREVVIGNQLYKSKSGIIYRLLKLTKSGINTFLEVNENNEPLIKKRNWAHHPQQQTAIFNGFSKLERI